MQIKSNLKRIVCFLLYKSSDFFTFYFWKTILRVWRERFFFFRKVSRREFIDNLRCIEARPWNLHIELTNICNANCIFCAYQFQARKKLVMSKEVYAKSLDDYCAIGGGELRLDNCVGDPLVDPDFVLRVKEARAHPEIARIITTTNGINLHRIGIEELLCSGINEILISTGPWDEKLYGLIYRSGEYARMRKNVTELLERNSACARPLSIKLLFRTNLSLRKTLKLADYQSIRLLPHEVEFNTDFDTWLGTITEANLLKGMHLRPLAHHENEPCYWLYDGPIVFADGKVGLCGCRDYNADSELVVGDISKDSLLGIWQSKKVQELRQRFWTGDPPEICQKCTVYSNLDIYRSTRGTGRARGIYGRFAAKSRE